MATTNAPTIQQRMKATLESVGLPYKTIEVYGSQIVITAWSREAAHKWGSLLTRFAKLRGFTESVDYAKENRNTVLMPSTVRVWRVFACIE